MLLRELLTKYGFSSILSAITVHSFYLAVKADIQNKAKEKELLERQISSAEDKNIIIEEAVKSNTLLTEKSELREEYDNSETRKVLDSRMQNIDEKISDSNTKILETANKSDIFGFLSNILENYSN